MMDDMDASDNLPPTYEFDIYLDIETTDYNKKKSNSRMFYSQKTALFAIEQVEGKETNLIVMDLDADLIAMYKNEDGKKTVQAIKNMLKLAGRYSVNTEDMEDFKFKKSGSTKDIAGYHCDGYEGETKDENMEAYLAPKFPIDWQDNYGGFIQKFMPASYSETANQMKGMIFYSENRLKENDKKFSLYEVKKVHEKIFRIDNDDYKKIKFGE